MFVEGNFLPQQSGGNRARNIDNRQQHRALETTTMQNHHRGRRPIGTRIDHQEHARRAYAQSGERTLYKSGGFSTARDIHTERDMHTARDMETARDMHTARDFEPDSSFEDTMSIKPEVILAPTVVDVMTVFENHTRSVRIGRRVCRCVSSEI